MKVYTDVEQSMKLDKILPKDSYDMYLSRIDDGRTYIPHFGKTIVIDRNMFSYRSGYVVPCWSLAALIKVLPKIHNLKPVIDLEEISIQYSGTDIYVTATDLVDACYETIIKNYEQNKDITI